MLFESITEVGNIFHWEFSAPQALHVRTGLGVCSYNKGCMAAVSGKSYRKMHV